MTQSSEKLCQEDPVLCAELLTFTTVGALFGAAAAIGVRAPLRPRLLAGFGFVLLYSLAFTSPSGSGTNKGEDVPGRSAAPSELSPQAPM
jgi:hypothetical protein